MRGKRIVIKGQNAKKTKRKRNSNHWHRTPFRKMNLSKNVSPRGFGEDVHPLEGLDKLDRIELWNFRMALKLKFLSSFL